MKPQFRSSMRPIQHVELDHILGVELDQHQFQNGFWDVKCIDTKMGIGH
jgi:hypothetical protein